MYGQDKNQFIFKGYNMELTEPEVIVLLPGDTFNCSNNMDSDPSLALRNVYVVLIPELYFIQNEKPIFQQAVNIISKGKT